MSDYENSGLYSLYYSVILKFLEDPTEAYLCGGYLLIFLCAISLFASVLILSDSLLFSTLVVGFFATSRIPLVWPRISFAAIIIFAYWAISLKFLRWRSRIAASALAAFLATFVRPEFSLSFIILFLVAITVFMFGAISAVRNSNPLGRIDTMTCGLLLVPILILSAVWSFPIVKGSGRAMEAFGQHYALRVVQTQHLTNNPWFEWRSFIDKDFSGVNSVLAAALVSPRKFFWFISANAYDCLTSIASFGTGIEQATGPYVTISSIGMFAMIAVTSSSKIGSGKSPFTTFGYLDFLLLSVLCTPVILAVTLVYPEDHYVIELMALSVFALAITVGLAIRTDWRVDAFASVIFALIFISVLRPLPVAPRVYLPVIQSMQGIHDIESMADADGGWCAYLSPTCNFILMGPAFTEGFKRFVKDEKPQTVMVSNLVRNALSKDVYFQGVLNAGEKDPRTKNLPSGFEIIYLTPRAAAKD